MFSTLCKSCCSRRELAAVGVDERVYERDRDRSSLFCCVPGGDRRCSGGFATGEQTSTIVTHATRRSARSAASSTQRLAAYLSAGRRSFESQFRTVQTPTCCSSFPHLYNCQNVIQIDRCHRASRRRRLRTKQRLVQSNLRRSW